MTLPMPNDSSTGESRRLDLIKIIAEDPAATEAPALSHGWEEQGTIVSPTLVMMRAIVDARFGDQADAAFGTGLDNVSRRRSRQDHRHRGPRSNAAEFVRSCTARSCTTRSTTSSTPE